MKLRLMIDTFNFTVIQQTEASTHVVLEQSTDVPVHSFAGKLIGPHCQFARTLPAEFPFTGITKQPGAHVAQVIDPCYWTPELPFLYDLQLNIQLDDGQEIEQTTQVGLTRWESHWRNLRLETQRIVLRGAGTTCPAAETLQSAREARTALLIKDINKATFDSAAELGVVLCLDLRDAENVDFSALADIHFSPSIFLALVSSEQRDEPKIRDLLPSHCLIAQCLSTESTESTVEESLDAGPVLAFDLKPGERPPAWVPMASRPVIAIRRSEDYTDLSQARAACDRLQAELAPEFNLAGYFVTP